jgi:hypothetical protein
MSARVPLVTPFIPSLSLLILTHTVAAQKPEAVLPGIALGPVWQDVRGGDSSSRRGWSVLGTTGYRLHSHVSVVAQAGLSRFPGEPQRLVGVTCIGPTPCPVVYQITGRVTAIALGAGLQVFTDASPVRFFATLSPELDWLVTRDIEAGAVAPGVGLHLGGAFSLTRHLGLVLQGTARQLSSSSRGPHWIRGITLGVVGL